MGLNYFASAPVLVMPQQRSHYFMHHPHDETDASQYAPMAVDRPQVKKIAPRFPSPPSMNYLANSNPSIAGRKRSRADVGDDHEVELETSAGPVQPPKPQAEPIYGPGMVLIYPDEPSLNISPESQSGTWMEEKAEIQAASAAAALTDRPRLPARKSSRRVSVDENLESTSSSGIDPIVLRLGIGWKRMTDAQASATAGEEAFIRNQYGAYIQSPKILLHHEGMNIYVVRSNSSDLRCQNHQWWIFQDDLKSCRLLCYANEDDVLRRLGNKKQDERGNWIPDILADGQIIYAKDVTPPPFPAHIAESAEMMDVC